MGGGAPDRASRAGPRAIGEGEVDPGIHAETRRNKIRFYTFPWTGWIGLVSIVIKVVSSGPEGGVSTLIKITRLSLRSSRRARGIASGRVQVGRGDGS